MDVLPFRKSGSDYLSAFLDQISLFHPFILALLLQQYFALFSYTIHNHLNKASEHFYLPGSTLINN